MALVVALVAVMAAACTPWGQWGHDATLSNFSPGEKTLTAANVSGLTEAWATEPIRIFQPFIEVTVSASMVVQSTAEGLLGYPRTGEGCTQCFPLFIGTGSNTLEQGSVVVADGRVYAPTSNADSYSPPSSRPPNIGISVFELP